MESAITGGYKLFGLAAPHLPLGSLCKFNKGKSITRKNLGEGEIPVIAGGQKPAYYGDKYNRTGETITISSSGAYAGFVSYWNEPVFVSDAFSVDPDERLNIKFLYHFLLSKQELIYRKKKGAGIPHVYSSDLAKIIIPLPPLEVQQRVADTLDAFTILKAELEAELEARIKQYEYYRDFLLSFPEQTDRQTILTEWKKLSEISTDFYRGAGIRREDLTSAGVPCVRYGDIYTKFGVSFDTPDQYTDPDTIKSKKYFEHGDLLFAITGEKVEEIGKSSVYRGNKKCLAGGDIAVMKHTQNPKYVAYALSTTHAQAQKSKGKIKSKVVHTSVPALMEIRIPIPSMAIQNEVVAILDRFDAMVHDIKTGLPAEIAARQKQYEYYRDQLLSFKEAES